MRTRRTSVIRGASPSSLGLRGYLVAIGAVGVLLAVVIGTQPLVGGRAAFLPFVLAVALAAWVGGLRPALVATVLGAAAGVAINIGTADLETELVRDAAALVTFVAVSLVVTLLAVQLSADRERARRSATRTAQLQSVSNAVARGLPPDGVARVVLREGLEALGAGAGVAGVTTDDGTTVQVLASRGHGADRLAADRTFPVDEGYPMSEAIRRRQPIVVADGDELRARYPALAANDDAAGSAVVLPLLYEDRAIGALDFRFDHTRSFDAEDHAYFLTLGRQCAAAIVRARLEEAERAATQRLAFLARSGEVLNASLDVDEVLVRLSGLVVPELADWSGVHMLEPDGSIRLVTVAHADPARAEAARAANPHPPALSDERGVGAVIRTGEVEHVASLSPEVAAQALADPAWGPIAGGVPPRAYAIVPLAARGRTLGSLALLTDASERTIGVPERQLAEELAARAAMALDNARLYRELATREGRRAAVARLGQQAIALGSPSRLEQAAARELVETLPDVEAAAVLEVAADDLHEAATASRDNAPAAPAARLAATDPDVREALAARRPVARAGRLVVPVMTSAGASALLVVARPRRPPADDEVGFVAEVAGVLGEALDRARRLEEERRAQELGRAFIGVVSHELRTPITSIYAGAKLLRRASRSEDDRAEIAEDVEAEADRLYRLTEDLLVLTRLERNDLEIGREPVLVSRLVERVVASERDHWPLIEFRMHIPAALPTAVGEDNYVEQVLRNLIGNAAKYSPSRSVVEIEASVAEDGGVAVRVLDRGPGVAAVDRARLFTLFYRSPATASQASGAGIGLFVCEQLVRAMGGRLWAEPRDGGGSEFGFALLPYLELDEEPAARNNVAAPV